MKMEKRENRTQKKILFLMGINEVKSIVMVKVKNLYGNSQKPAIVSCEDYDGLFFVSLQKVYMAQLVITGDGSHTLFVPELNEHYHSTHGALTESLHVFIRSGLDCFAGSR